MVVNHKQIQQSETTNGTNETITPFPKNDKIHFHTFFNTSGNQRH